VPRKLSHLRFNKFLSLHHIHLLYLLFQGEDQGASTIVAPPNTPYASRNDNEDGSASIASKMRGGDEDEEDDHDDKEKNENELLKSPNLLPVPPLIMSPNINHPQGGGEYKRPPLPSPTTLLAGGHELRRSSSGSFQREVWVHCFVSVLVHISTVEVLNIHSMRDYQWTCFAAIRHLPCIGIIAPFAGSSGSSSRRRRCVRPITPTPGLFECTRMCTHIHTCGKENILINAFSLCRVRKGYLHY